MNRLAIIAAALVLAGCAHQQRYVRVPCISPDQLEQQRKAEPPRISDKLTGKADEDVKIIAGSAVRLRAFSHGLLGILEGCVG